MTRYFLSFLLVILTSCSYDYRTRGMHETIPFENNSDIEVWAKSESVYPDEKERVPPYGNSLHQDFLHSPGMYKVAPHSISEDALDLVRWNTYEWHLAWLEETYNIKTQSIFIFRGDLAYGVENLSDYLLARYDVTLEDLVRLDWKLSYPPGEEMVGIKIWTKENGWVIPE